MANTGVAPGGTIIMAGPIMGVPSYAIIGYL